MNSNLVSKSLVERLDVSIPENLEGVRGKDGRNYSWFGLGHSLVAVPFYVIGNYIGASKNAVLKINLFYGPAVGISSL